jgi:hypothetical protein
MRGWWKTLLLLAAAAALAAGCSSKHRLVPGAPEWVNRGGGAYRDAGERVFYGVGAVTGIASQPLAAQAAEQRARAEVARQLDTYVAELYRDFQTSSAAGGQAPAEAQQVEGTLKTVTQVSVRGARIVEHWREPQSGTVYALARLDLDGIKATLEQADRIDPQLRGYLYGNAEKAFDALQQQEAKR